MTEHPNDAASADPAGDGPDTESGDRSPAADEATPEQPVVQRSGTPLVDRDGADGRETPAADGG
ncbi:MAG TPA: hypothetical protein VEX57_09020 [Microlunatus sp.]|nr:hypothetical protein [Microlunatus sp.]